MNEEFRNIMEMHTRAELDNMAQENLCKLVYLYNADTKALSFKFKFDADKDLDIDMGCPTAYGNGLFDFMKFYFTNNAGNLNKSFTADSTISFTGTDFFAPYKGLKAVNNIDGDLPSGYADQFTGGCHLYNNATTGATATARLGDFFILVDGNEPVSGVAIGCNEIKVVWTNYIQGVNTKKADGTGREILKETLTAVITSNGIEVHNEIEALEDLTIARYYGMEAHLTSASKFLYLGGTQRTPQNTSTNSGNKTCNSGMLSNLKLAIEMNFDNTYDLGQLMYNPSAYSVFASGEKIYALTIDTTATLTLGCKMFTRGKYKFLKPFATA